MSRHLLMISVGPVVDFIAASRRTRDVHYSSWLVAKMGREAARVLGEFGDLVFPCNVNDDNTPVSDRVLCWLRDAVDPRVACQLSKAAVVKVWKDEARQVKASVQHLGVNETLWNQQLIDEDLVEFFSAWVQFDAPDSDSTAYQDARKNVEKLLNAREKCTDFSQWTGPGAVTKNTLDGRRETVLSDPNLEQVRQRVRRGINPGEQLDMPGVVKRLGVGVDSHFVSLSRLAADPFIRGSVANRKRASVIQRVTDALGAVGAGASDSIDFRRIGDERWAPFQFDAQLLMPQRVKSMIREYKDCAEFAGLFNQIESALSSGGSEPFPYLAVLACDGDNMSRHPGITSLSSHQVFSKGLSEFANNARTIVDQFRGSLVYAGGDDVLAFFPLDMVLPCAEKLREAFAGAVGGTLSMGIAIVHVLTPMAGSMIKFAYDAEARAKSARTNTKSKNSLSIALHKRSGSPLYWTSFWTDEPVKQLNQYSAFIENDVLSKKAAYSLRALADLYSDQTGKQLPWVTSDLVRAEVSRVMDKKKIQEDRRAQVVADFLERIGGGESTAVEDVRQISSALILAKVILVAENQAKGK